VFIAQLVETLTVDSCVNMSREIDRHFAGSKRMNGDNEGYMS
jgi:hypothetical protein